MKVSAQWLKEWVDPDLSSEELGHRLTMAGLELDELSSAVSGLSGVNVAKVIESDRHPDADKLSYCMVDTGSERAAVVCGAPNVRAGLMVAYAAPGAVLPGGQKIKKARIRGIESAGMLCSAAELGLGDDASGLLELDGSATLGESLITHLNLEDDIFDIDLTPNRGDCLSVTGIAREVAVLTGAPMKPIDVPAVAPDTTATFPIVLDAPMACPRYVGRVIDDVNCAAPTPDWMVERLRRAGVRSISAVVDVTNFVMLELGQPMHGFDLEKLNDGIRVRNGRAGEKLELLDGQTIELDETTLVIADETHAVALAGVMGGMATGVEHDTRRVFLESAFFDPITLAGVARRYRLHTDASHRFERGVDFMQQERAVERATALIVSICGGKPGTVTVAEVRENLPARTAIHFDPTRVQKVIGIDVDTGRCASILAGLHCQVDTNTDGLLRVVPPDFRFDLELEADLLEEIARVYGYDNILETLPKTSMMLSGESQRRDRDERIRDILITQGYYEAITYSFIDSESGRRMAPERTAYPLANPISADMSDMRTSIWPGLLKAAVHNRNRQISDIRFFEIGMVFEQREKDLEQRTLLAGLAYGDRVGEQWGSSPEPVDFYDIKQTITSILCAYQWADVAWFAGDEKALHPGQSARLEINGNRIGSVGVLHPSMAHNYGFDKSPILFEIELDRLGPLKVPAYAPISKFPTVRRDISVVVDDEIPAGAILDAVHNVAGARLRDLQLFDVYRGQGIDSDKKSLALGLIFQAHSSTLTDEEIEAIMKRVLLQLHDDFGGTLRN